MSRDPIGQLGSLSEYLFAGNKASIGYDVLGLKPKAKKCDEKNTCEENIQSLDKWRLITRLRYEELFKPEYLREAMDDSLLPPERQYKKSKGRTDLRGREVWENHKTKYEEATGNITNCINVIKEQFRDKKCDCCNRDKTYQWMAEIERDLESMERKPPALPVDEMWPVMPNLPEIIPADLAKKPGITWRKIGWNIVGVGAGVGAIVLAAVPWDGPIGEAASFSLASAAFARAATCVAPVIIVHISSDVLLDEMP